MATILPNFSKVVLLAPVEYVANDTSASTRLRSSETPELGIRVYSGECQATLMLMKSSILGPVFKA